MSLKSKVAVVTGGARGIGKAIATSFAENGAKVTIVSRTAAEVQKTTSQLTNKKFDVIGVAADISIFADVQKVVTETIRSFKTIDILVNCAGIQKPIGLFSDVTLDEWIDNIHGNLIGTAMCCKAVLPIMIDKRKGKIINFSGGGATSPRPNFSAYACSKAAVVRLTETLAMEVRDYGIDVNAIAPGAVKTRMTQEVMEAGGRAGEKELSEARATMRDGGAPAELAAELAVFLAGQDSDGLSGRLISAVWDDWKNFAINISEISNSSLYTLRRIDGKSFREIK